MAMQTILKLQQTHKAKTAANIGNKSSPPTDSSSTAVGRYLKDLRKQMSMNYQKQNNVKAILKVKGRKTSDAEETYVVIDDKVSEIYTELEKPCPDKLQLMVKPRSTRRGRLTSWQQINQGT
ncbi:hypothetical protein DAPPUDRAFT_318814 [Daphnia pulex]|uniref:Uncharacterized protein n=1 Tax=Daphnia pulex TaxID=6669 RepID=E9GJR0_DAPPU|nr:hypothetical protein DAPPUDRAFT_318814 [Daphnia pulex]|eukprot:EFX80272.1 hypothetical protein DAPPUDRAFT_318814 [Daphnia pulex]